MYDEMNVREVVYGEFVYVKQGKDCLRVFVNRILFFVNLYIYYNVDKYFFCNIYLL